MKDRGDKVSLGQATDALQRPSVESLTNQDAEPAVEAPPDVPQAEAEQRVEVIDPKTGKLVPIPEGGRYYDAGGTLGRRYGGQRGSTKPDSIPSALWPTMSKQQKAKAREEAARVFKKGVPLLALPLLLRLPETTRTTGKSSVIDSLDIITSQEGNCFRPILRIAHYLCRAYPTKGRPRSFP